MLTSFNATSKMPAIQKFSAMPAPTADTTLPADQQPQDSFNLNNQAPANEQASANVDTFNPGKPVQPAPGNLDELNQANNPQPAPSAEELNQMFNQPAATPQENTAQTPTPGMDMPQGAPGNAAPAPSGQMSDAELMQLLNEAMAQEAAQNPQAANQQPGAAPNTPAPIGADPNALAAGAPADPNGALAMPGQAPQKKSLLKPLALAAAGVAIVAGGWKIFNGRNKKAVEAVGEEVADVAKTSGKKLSEHLQEWIKGDGSISPEFQAAYKKAHDALPIAGRAEIGSLATELGLTPAQINQLHDAVKTHSTLTKLKTQLNREIRSENYMHNMSSYQLGPSKYQSNAETKLMLIDRALHLNGLHRQALLSEAVEHNSIKILRQALATEKDPAKLARLQDVHDGALIRTQLLEGLGSEIHSPAMSKLHQVESILTLQSLGMIPAETASAHMKPVIGQLAKMSPYEMPTANLRNASYKMQKAIMEGKSLRKTRNAVFDFQSTVAKEVYRGAGRTALVDSLGAPRDMSTMLRRSSRLGNTYSVRGAAGRTDLRLPGKFARALEKIKVGTGPKYQYGYVPNPGGGPFVYGPPPRY